MKLVKTLGLTLAILLAGNSLAWAGEIVKKPLEEVFNKALILPYDYHNKVFLNGRKTDFYGQYKLYQRNDRVLVPVRLMGNLVSSMDGGSSYWQVNWDQQKPDDVILVNHRLQKTVKLKVNSKTMYINNVAKTLDVPPQKIEGRIVLPLRGIAEALDKKIEWLQGLILVSDEYIDLQSPGTLGLKDKIKAGLTDKRRAISNEQTITPLSKYGDTLYYIKVNYGAENYTIDLYKKAGSQQEAKIALPGEVSLNNNQVLNNELYYVTKINGKSELQAFNFADDKARKVCSLGQWNPEDGWLGQLKYLNDELYVVLHTGDNTMGGDTIYKLEAGQLKELASAKSAMNFTAIGDYFYYTDFRFMTDTTGNLNKVNMKTGEKETLGEAGFTYGILRVVSDDGGRSYTGNNAFYAQDGFIYTLGYREDDEQDQAAVYKVSMDGQSHQKLSQPTKAFWLVDDRLYYIDLHTGHLVQVDLEGNNHKTVTTKTVLNVQFFNGNIYYTAAENGDTALGALYKYNLASGQEVKLSDHAVSQFFVGAAGVYYVSEGYELGLYKIAANDKNTILKGDSIQSAMLTDTGLVYTLRYADGIYLVK